MRSAAIAAFLFLFATPAFAGQDQSHAAGHFAGEIDAQEEGMVKPVENPPAATGLGARATTAAPPVATLPRGVAKPNSQLPSAAQPKPGTPNGAANQQSIDDVRRRLEDKAKDAESEDRLGNFEIQDLMQQHNQSQTLRSNTQKKLDDAKANTVGNVK